MNKENEREELHKTIWKIANNLRGSVDGWDFKQYVLGLLFYRFISENIENYIDENEHRAGNHDFKYRELSDEIALKSKKEMVRTKGFFILPSELFCNLRKRAKNDPDLNINIGKIFNNIENSSKGTDSEKDVKGLFDDFKANDNKLGNTVEERNEKITKMLNEIGDLKLDNYQGSIIDTFGDAYEFLMTMYASNAGKSGGEFFTPQEVGELLAKITLVGKNKIKRVYDPCCGSGGLLLKFAKVLGKENVIDGFFGQEVNLTTYNLARINMFLHDINYNKFNIAHGDTLMHPAHWDFEPFDAIVSNPPYSIPWKGKTSAILINDERFSPAGVLAPESKADLAFTMHMLSWLAEDGTAAIVEYPGVLKREGTEKQIREYMVKNNYIDTVIQLPKDLFFGTPIATCILVLKKSKKTSDILFIDASSEFIRKDTKNKLSDENIENILKLIEKREEVEDKSAVIPIEDVLSNDSNLQVSNYLTSAPIIDDFDINESIAFQSEVIKVESDLRNSIHSNLDNLKKMVNDIIKKENVTFVKLSDITDFANGKGHEKAINKDGKYIVVNAKFISTNGKVIKRCKEQLSPLIKDDITLVMSDLPNGRALSRTFLIPENDKYTLNQRIGLLRIKDDRILPKFLAYVLDRNEQLLAYDNKVDQTNLRKADILNVTVPIPSIKTQELVIQKLDEYTKNKELLIKSLEDEIYNIDSSYKYYRNQALNFKELDDNE